MLQSPFFSEYSLDAVLVAENGDYSRPKRRPQLSAIVVAVSGIPTTIVAENGFSSRQCGQGFRRRISMADSIRDSIQIVMPDSIRYSIRTPTADSQVPTNYIQFNSNFHLTAQSQGSPAVSWR